MVGMKGFEPSYTDLSDQPLDQLEYMPIKKYPMTESNRQPSGCKPDHLPIDIIGLV